MTFDKKSLFSSSNFEAKTDANRLQAYLDLSGIKGLFAVAKDYGDFAIHKSADGYFIQFAHCKIQVSDHLNACWVNLYDAPVFDKPIAALLARLCMLIFYKTPGRARIQANSEKQAHLMWSACEKYGVPTEPENQQQRDYFTAWRNDALHEETLHYVKTNAFPFAPAPSQKQIAQQRNALFSPKLNKIPPALYIDGHGFPLFAELVLEADPFTLKFDGDQWVLGWGDDFEVVLTDVSDTFQLGLLNEDRGKIGSYERFSKLIHLLGRDRSGIVEIEGPDEALEEVTKELTKRDVKVQAHHKHDYEKVMEYRRRQAHKQQHNLFTRGAENKHQPGLNPTPGARF